MNGRALNLPKEYSFLEPELFASLAGGLVGGLAGGIAARIVMRVVAIAVNGSPTFTASGTAEVISLGALVGTFFGLVYWKFRRLPLQVSGFNRVLIYGGLLAALFGVVEIPTLALVRDWVLQTGFVVAVALTYALVLEGCYRALATRFQGHRE